MLMGDLAMDPATQSKFVYLCSKIEQKRRRMVSSMVHNK
jgi:hypothetical protein